VVLTGGAFTHKKQDFGFFETPAPIADRLVRAAAIEASHRVLEPSAGRGALLRALATHIPTRKVELTAVELMPDNVRALVAGGWDENVVEADFLLFVERPFDRIIMNPPFARQADVDHVRHAYELLAFGGRLVSVVAAGIKFRRNQKTDALRALIETNGSIRDLPDGAFHDSGTDVCTVLVTLDKPCGCDVHGERGAECQP
jgi:predicted RNA methylase